MLVQKIWWIFLFANPLYFILRQIFNIPIWNFYVKIHFHQATPLWAPSDLNNQNTLKLGLDDVSSRCTSNADPLSPHHHCLHSSCHSCSFLLTLDCALYQIWIMTLKLKIRILIRLNIQGISKSLFRTTFHLNKPLVRWKHNFYFNFYCLPANGIWSFQLKRTQK